MVGSGSETVEVFADTANFHELLTAFGGTLSVNRENGFFNVAMREGFSSQDLNQFLFEKGVVASHLVTQKKSLEKQFLEILAGS
jgi:ABC-2 type transport system ATP-binding protein